MPFTQGVPVNTSSFLPAKSYMPFWILFVEGLAIVTKYIKKGWKRPMKCKGEKALWAVGKLLKYLMFRKWSYDKDAESGSLSIW